VDKDTWEFYPVVGAHALLELMKCQQVAAAARLSAAPRAYAFPATPQYRNAAVERNQRKTAQVAAGDGLPLCPGARLLFSDAAAQSSLLGRKIQVQQLLTQHLSLMHEVYSTLLQADM
jgi:hypothetical protein